VVQDFLYCWQDGYGEFSDGITHNGLLDQIMREITGKDNYPGVQHDTTFGMDTLDPLYPNNSTLLNTAFYRHLLYS
jgi:hypothetical protein